MIWHALEVWGLLLVAFAVGGALGTLLYAALAVSPLAAAQTAAADTVGQALAGLRAGIGLGRGEGPAPRRRVAEAWPAGAASESAVGRESLQAEWPHEPEPVAEAIVTVEEGPRPQADGWDDEVPFPEEGEDEIHPVPGRAVAETASVPSTPPPLEPLPDLPAMRPLTLPGPRNGVPDNLQRIRGIGQKNEELLYSLGVYHFGQIAAWTPAEARWIASHLAFPERIERDDWIGQAIILASGGNTGYVKTAERRRSAEDELPPATGP